MSKIYPTQQTFIDGLQYTPELEAGLVSLGQGKPMVSVSTVETAEGAAEKEMAKGFAKQSVEAYGDVIKAGKKASGDISNINAAITFSDLAPEGATATLEVLGGKASEILGIDSEMAEKLPAAEAFQMLSKNMTLDATAKLSGAVSDKDLDLIEMTGPQLSQTKEGRKLILQMRKATAEREREVARLATKYRKEKGKFDTGDFEIYKEDYFAEKPLFGDNLIEGVMMTTPINTPDGRVITFDMLKQAAPNANLSELTDVYIKAMRGGK